MLRRCPIAVPVASPSPCRTPVGVPARKDASMVQQSQRPELASSWTKCGIELAKKLACTPTSQRRGRVASED